MTENAMTALYTERAQLVAALSKCFPASLEADPAEPDWPVCLIDLPSGQVSWHIASGDLHLFDHLPRNAGRAWDGHDTPTKYARLNALHQPTQLSHFARVMASEHPETARALIAQEMDAQEARARFDRHRQQMDARFDNWMNGGRR